MAKDTLDVVKMFRSTRVMNKQKVFGDLLNTKMIEDGSVVNHVQKLMEYMQKFKDNRGVMDDGTQVNAILRT